MGASVAQAGERRLEAPKAHVRLVSLALPTQAVPRFPWPAKSGRGSDIMFAGVAQGSEHAADNRKATGPNPVPGTAFATLCRIRRPVLDGRVGCAGVVQQAEQRSCKSQVGGSIPSASPVAVKITTTGLTTGGTMFGRVPAAATGTGCSPVGLRAFGGSTPSSPTGRNESRGYYECVPERSNGADCKSAGRKTFVGSNPTALSGRKASRECCRGVVEGYNTGLSRREVGVQVPSPLLLKQQEQDTTAARSAARGIGIVAVHLPSKQVHASSILASRSPFRIGGTGRGDDAAVAYRLAKSDVTGSNPVSRSTGGATAGGIPGRGWPRTPCNGLLVQPGRALDSKSSRCTFESCAARISRSEESVVI